MSLFLRELLSSVLQIIIFSIIPFTIWFFKYRKVKNFLNWIGLKPIEIEYRKNVILLTIAVTILFFISTIFPLYLTKDIDMATSIFDGLGIDAIPTILIFSFLKTGLSEEMLFRGFILKTLLSKFKFNTSNIIQGLLFGLLHGILFMPIMGLTYTIMITLITGFEGWCMGYINEKKANGSIIPSIIIHGFGNTFSSCLTAFSIF